MNPSDRPTATEVVALCREVGSRLGVTEVLPEAGWLPEQYTVVSVPEPGHSPVPAGNLPVPPSPAPASRTSRKRLAAASAVLAAAGIAALTVWIGPWSSNSNADEGNQASDNKPSSEAPASKSPTEEPPGAGEDEVNLKDRVDNGLRDCDRANSLCRPKGAKAALSCKPKYGPGTVISESEANQITVTVASFPRNSAEYESFLESEEKEVQDDGPRVKKKGDPSVLPLLGTSDFPYRGPVENHKGVSIGEVFTHKNIWEYSTVTWTFTNDAYVDRLDEYFVVMAKSKDREALMKWWNDWTI